MVANPAIRDKKKIVPQLWDAFISDSTLTEGRIKNIIPLIGSKTGSFGP